jgi:hypothetical protein
MHEDGDILILSDFTQGGGTVTIRVYQWNGPGGTIAGQGAIDGVLDLIAGGDDPITGDPIPADCIGPPSVANDDEFCATVNVNTETAPWPFVPKVGTSGNFAPGEFYEGGIDLSFLGLAGQCFSSFLAESRASTSTDSTLSDFAGGTFESCTSSTVTYPSDDEKQQVASINLGDSIHDYAIVSGLGGDPVPTGTVTFYICSPSELTNGACEDPDLEDDVHTGTLVSTENVAQLSLSPPKADALSDAFTPDVIGTWCFRAEYSGDENYPASVDQSTGECFDVLQQQPTMTTAQTWSVYDTVTITVTNTTVPLSGTVSFFLYANSCDTTPVFSDEDNAVAGSAVVDGVSSATVQSGTHAPAATALWLWKVVYESGINNHASITGTCGNENTELTIDNGVSEPQPSS